MARSGASRLAVPGGAALAIGVAAYAWVGPLWFTGVPAAVTEAPRPDGPRQALPPRVGTERETEYGAWIEALTALRGPEQEIVPEEVEDPGDGDEGDDMPLADAGVLQGWRYVGYVGGEGSLIGVVELPSGVQHWAVVGERLGSADGAPVVIRATKTEIELEVGGVRKVLGYQESDGSGGSEDRGGGLRGRPAPIGAGADAGGDGGWGVLS